MKMALDEIDARLVVQGYGPGELAVGGRTYDGSVLITPDGVQADWGPTGVEDLTARHVMAWLDHAPELVILGTGARQEFPSPRLFVDLIDAQIGYEVMDTAAACRTFNILLGEGRRVIAALFL